MSEPFLGEIKMIGFNFPPRGWALCDGQTLAIAQNSALFSLLGTTFGGDGRTTFGLPDLRGRNPLHVGSGPGLATVTWGQKSGTNTYQLTTAEMPAHNHTVTPRGRNGAGDETNPGGGYFASHAGDPYAENDNPPNGVDMGAFNSGSTGGGASFSVFEPLLGIYHVIALQGLYPSRS